LWELSFFDLFAKLSIADHDDPWEPDKTWFTSASSNTNTTENIPKNSGITTSTYKPFNKAREYAKILHLMREVRKSLTENNKKSTENENEKPTVKTLPQTEHDVPVKSEVPHSLRQEEHKTLLDKLHAYMSNRHWKPKEARPGMLGPQKG
jgi:hypothetical protein